MHGRLVHVISRKRLRDFSSQHPGAAAPLDAWFRIMSRTDFVSFNALRGSFASADKVGGMTVFNIGGNKYRLITASHFDRRRVYIRHVLTHNEYDKGSWKE